MVSNFDTFRTVKIKNRFVVEEVLNLPNLVWTVDLAVV
jgi:hypothetical protein